jgi:hypothetical protein
MTMPICTATRVNTLPCTAAARPGTAFCFAHDPELQARRQAGRFKGGANKATHRRLDKLTPASLRPVLDALFTALAGLQDGTIEPKRATAMATVSGAIVRCYEVAEAEPRIKALEVAHEQQRTG